MIRPIELCDDIGQVHLMLIWGWLRHTLVIITNGQPSADIKWSFKVRTGATQPQTILKCRLPSSLDYRTRHGSQSNFQSCLLTQDDSIRSLGLEAYSCFRSILDGLWKSQLLRPLLWIFSIWRVFRFVYRRKVQLTRRELDAIIWKKARKFKRQNGTFKKSDSCKPVILQ
jgi:hypothetical protein